MGARPRVFDPRRDPVARLSAGGVGSAFQLLGLVPDRHAIEAFQARPSWNYTTFLNLAALALAAVMGWRFLTTGGVQMLRAMQSAPTSGREMVHDHHEHHHHH